MNYNINNFEHKINKKLIDVEGYGKLYTCNNPNERCGLCLNAWNYQHELIYINECKKLLTQNSIGIDVGAHTGTYAIALKDYIKTMYSFEPQIYGYDALCFNAGLYNNIVPIRLNCGDVSNESPDLPVVQLDNFFNDDLIPNFVKIDVEGQEIKILHGMKSMLNKTDYLVMVIELGMAHVLSSGYKKEDFWEALKLCGLDCDDFVKTTIDPIMQDNLFCNVLIHKNNSIVKAQIFEKYYT